MNKIYIDGENFLFKLANILKDAHLIREKSEITRFKLSQIGKILSQTAKINATQFYAAKLHYYDNSPTLAKKSNVLIESQRRLKRYLTNDNVDFITSGHVRLQSFTPADNKRREQILFKEKGVDVKLAIDVMADVCDKKVKTVFLVSSDSDMIPVVREVRRRGARVVYVGFATQPNHGLIATCDMAILLRNEEVISAYIDANSESSKKTRSSGRITSLGMPGHRDETSLSRGECAVKPKPRAKRKEKK